MVSAIGVGFALVLVGGCILGILFAGIKALVSGKQDTKKLVMMSAPFVIFGIAFGVTGGAVEAGVSTMLILMAFMLFLIAFTGLRGTFKF